MPGDAGAPGTGANEAEQELDGGGLAGAVGTEQTEDLAAPHLHREIDHRAHLAAPEPDPERLGEVLRDDDSFHRRERLPRSREPGKKRAAGQRRGEVPCGGRAPRRTGRGTQSGRPSAGRCHRAFVTRRKSNGWDGTVVAYYGRVRNSGSSPPTSRDTLRGDAKRPPTDRMCHVGVRAYSIIAVGYGGPRVALPATRRKHLFPVTHPKEHRT